MKNNRIFKLFLVSYAVFFLMSAGLSAAGSPEEGGMHFNMAQESYKKGDIQEAVRALKEVIYYYDTEHLEAYRLLMDIYKKTGRKAELKNLQSMYKQVVSAQKLRKQKPAKELTTAETLRFGLPSEKIEACRRIAAAQDTAAIPSLIATLQDPYYDYYFGVYQVRAAAGQALASFGEKAVPQLVSAAASKNEDIRSASVAILHSISRDKETVRLQAIKVFRSAADDRSPQVRAAGISALAGSAATVDIEILVRRTSDADTRVRMLAVQSLGMAGAAVQSVPGAGDALLRCAADTDRRVVNEAINALIRTKSGDDVTAVLLKIAEDTRQPTITRWYAVQGLGGLLGETRKGELEKFLTDDNFWLRSAAALALGKTLPDEQKSAGLALREKEIFDETALKLSLTSSVVFEEARQQGLEKALKYLASVQKDDGSFPSYYPLGTAQLAALCFMKQGYKEDTPLVKKAFSYMFKHRKEDGSFYSNEPGAEPGDQKIAFTTSLAIRVLAETRSARYRGQIEAAMNWLKNIQNEDGGFGYYKGSRSDITSTNFTLLALDRAYDYFGRPKTDETWLKALDYLKNVQNEDGGFGYNKQEEKHSYGSATASGYIGLSVAGADEKNLNRAFGWMSENYTWETNPFDTNPRHFQYYLHEAACAFQLSGKDVITDKAGAQRLWHDDIMKKLLSEQDKSGWWSTASEPLFTTYFIGVLQLKKASGTLKSM